MRERWKIGVKDSGKLSFPVGAGQLGLCEHRAFSLVYTADES